MRNIHIIMISRDHEMTKSITDIDQLEAYKYEYVQNDVIMDCPAPWTKKQNEMLKRK